MKYSVHERGRLKFSFLPLHFTSETKATPLLTVTLGEPFHSGPEIPGSAKEGKPRSFFLCFVAWKDGFIDDDD
jgi:hypothetical protein